MKATGQPYHAVLRYRVDHDNSAASMAGQISAQLNRNYSVVAMRKLLQRARDRFADLLLDEIAASLETADLDLIEEELASLELLSYCQPAIERRRQLEK